MNYVLLIVLNVVARVFKMFHNFCDKRFLFTLSFMTTLSTVSGYNIPYKQKYWQTLYSAVCLDNAVGRILNWQISLLHGEKPMLVDRSLCKLIWRSLHDHQIKIALNISAYTVCIVIIL